MLQSIDDVSSVIPLDDDDSFASQIRSFSDTYFSLQGREVELIHTEGHCRLVKFSENPSSQILTALKTFLYFTGIAPILSSIINVLIPRNDQQYRYFYQDREAHPSLWIKAIEDQDLPTIKALYAFDPSVIHDKDAAGTPALLKACETGNLEIVSYLLDHNADIKAVNQYGQTAFLYACYCGNLTIAKYLYDVTEGTSLQDRDNSNNTPFTTACMHEDSSSLDTLSWLYEVTQGAVLQDRDVLGETGFMKLCSQNFSKHLSSIEWLYQQSHGSVLQDRDFEGNTAFMTMVYQRNYEAAEWLLEQSHEKVLKDKDLNGKTAFLRSCEEGFLDAAKWLYEKSHGEVIKDKDFNEYTAFTIAQKSDFLNIRVWLSSIHPNSGISQKISFNPLLSSHLPRKIYELCKHQRLFKKELHAEAVDHKHVTTLCHKERKDLHKTAKLSICLEEPEQGSPDKEALVYLSYTPSDLKKEGFEKISFKFNHHHLLTIGITQNGITYEKPCFSWNDEQDYIDAIVEDILPKFFY
jgi:ankyrin repeat protein